MRIANNVIALNINNNMSKTDKKIALSMGRLSSGLKINKVKDDAAGYAIATRFDMQVQGYTRGSENALDGISLIQTAEGYLSSVHEMLQRSRELAVQAANGTNSAEETRTITEEIRQLTDEIDAISKKANFNGINLLDGGAERLAKDKNPDLSKVSYATTGLPDGILNYTINSYGTPPSYATGYNGTQAVTTSGSININGSSINFEAGEDPSVTYAKILQACDDNNLNFDEKTGTFSGLEAGSKFNISISGDTAILGELGIAATAPIAGTDAVVTVDSYIKKSDGTVDTTYAPTIIADGNDVTLVSLNNQYIELELIPVDPIKGTPNTPGSTSAELTDEGPITLQLGGTMNATLSMSIPKINAKTLGIDYINCATLEGATLAISNLDLAIEKVSEARANLGAYQNRLEFSSESLQIAADSTTTSLSRIRDTDMAKEMTEYTKDSVAFQAATAMLAQANERPQLVLQLIR